MNYRTYNIIFNEKNVKTLFTTHYLVTCISAKKINNQNF